MGLVCRCKCNNTKITAGETCYTKRGRRSFILFVFTAKQEFWDFTSAFQSYYIIRKRGRLAWLIRKVTRLQMLAGYYFRPPCPQAGAIFFVKELEYWIDFPISPYYIEVLLCFCEAFFSVWKSATRAHIVKTWANVVGMTRGWRQDTRGRVSRRCVSTYAGFNVFNSE